MPEEKLPREGSRKGSMGERTVGATANREKRCDTQEAGRGARGKTMGWGNHLRPDKGSREIRLPPRAISSALTGGPFAVWRISREITEEDGGTAGTRGAWGRRRCSRSRGQEDWGATAEPGIADFPSQKKLNQKMSDIIDNNFEHNIQWSNYYGTLSIPKYSVYNFCWLLGFLKFDQS